MIAIAHGTFAGFTPWSGETPGPRRMGLVQNTRHAPRGVAQTTRPVQFPSQASLAGPELGFLTGIATFLVDGLAFLFESLAAILRTTVDFLMEGVDLVFGGLADIVGDIPILGPLLGKILLFGASVIEFVLDIPVRLLQGTANILTGIGEYITETWGEDRTEAEINGAREDILSQGTAAGLGAPVAAILAGLGVTGSDTNPNTSRNPSNPSQASTTRGSAADIAANRDSVDNEILGVPSGDILTYGIPAAGGAVALAILLG